VNPFGHVDVRVADMDAALPFYEEFLPVVGFTTRTHGPEWKCFDAPSELPREVYFALSGPKEYPEYGPGYYAVFFEDPSGNRLEVMHRSRG
jgi:predicted enzyme related to lactoylglutathione lyase